MPRTPRGPPARCPQRARLPKPQQRGGAPKLDPPGQASSDPRPRVALGVRGSVPRLGWGDHPQGARDPVHPPGTRPGMPYSPPEPDDVGGAEEDEEEPQLGPGGRQHPARAGGSAEPPPRPPRGAGQPGSPPPRGSGRGPGGWVPAASRRRAGASGHRGRRGWAGLGLGWAGSAGRLERGAEAAPEKEEEGRGCESICLRQGNRSPGGRTGRAGRGTPGCQARLPARSHGHGMGTVTATGTPRQRDGALSPPGPASRHRAWARSPLAGSGWNGPVPRSPGDRARPLLARPGSALQPLQEPGTGLPGSAQGPDAALPNLTRPRSYPSLAPAHRSPARP